MARHGVFEGLPEDYRDAFKEGESGHMRRCENDPDGPACKLREEMKDMRKRLEAVDRRQIKIDAVLGFWKWALPVALAASGAVTAALGYFIRAHSGG
jgi:hypothetical protein